MISTGEPAAPSADCVACQAEAGKQVDHYEYLRCKPVMRTDCPACVQRYECPRHYLGRAGLDHNGKSAATSQSNTRRTTLTATLSQPRAPAVCQIANETYKLGETIEYRKRYCSFCSCFDEGSLLAPVPPEDTDEGDAEENDGGNSSTSSTPRSQPPAKPQPVIARPRCSSFSCSRVSRPTEPGKHCFSEKDGDSCCPKMTCVSAELLAKGEFSVE